MPFSSEIRNTSSKEVLPVKTSFYVDRNDVQGALRVLWWPPRVKTRSEITSILVFTCGNPGIPQWYIQFLSLIRERSTPGLAIASCGHIGHAHDLQQPVSSSSLSLASQIEAHAAVLEGLRELFPSARFVSLSHSIGAYISLKVAHDFPDMVTSIIALQPTISNIGYTPNGRVMKYFFLEPIRTILALLGAFLVQAFPFVLSLLFKSWEVLSLKHLKDFVASSSTSHAAMTMASDEMTLVTDLDTGLVMEMRGKLRILYSESGDMWVGNNGDHVIEVLGVPSHIKFAPIPHAFCLNHSTEAAEACLPWIKQALDNHAMSSILGCH